MADTPPIGSLPGDPIKSAVEAHDEDALAEAIAVTSAKVADIDARQDEVDASTGATFDQPPPDGQDPI